MLRKIFSSLLLVIFLTNTISLAFAVNIEASVLDINQNITSSKETIKKLKNGSRYLFQLNKVDKFLNSQTDLKLLEKIKVKLDTKRGLVA
jgi:hypothetical protein